MLELDRAEEGRLRPFEIEQRTLFAQPNLSRMIDRLEREGLVRREAFRDDGRGQWVVITDAGRQKRAEMWGTYGAAIRRYLGDKLSEAEATTLAELLGKLVKEVRWAGAGAIGHPAPAPGGPIPRAVSTTSNRATSASGVTSM